MGKPPRQTPKYRLIDALRASGALKFADSLKYWLHRASNWPSNRRFRRNNPGFAVPPHDLAFDAYNHANWEEYRRVGKLHAGVFADIVSRRIPPGDLSVLEWGCGPGRLIRHMGGLLAGYSLQLTGADYNAHSIDWCSSNLPGIRFVRNGLMPPLALGDDEFDVIYNFSVFTHLSEEAQNAWAGELRRVLKPGGLIICSTHGEGFRHLLTSREDVDRYQAGELVVKGKYAEGKKWYLAIHPETYVRETLLKDFDGVSRVEVAEDRQLAQDIWVGVKPAI